MSATEPAESAAGAPLGDVSVEIRDVHVKYRVYEETSFGFRDLVSNGFKGRTSTTVHAVQNVSFNVRIGEAVGIVGSNGSGKSTLLRSIAGLQAIESGSIRVGGRAQLLGVGSALKRNLSGRRNVMLGGLAMGLPRAEIEDRMDEVIEFSGLGEAINRPMNTYSSGMNARLAFTIATLRIPEILLIDEALAVGDKEFRAKSLERIEEIRAQAGTVIMVTHNMAEIQKSCTRALWLDRGVLRADGPVEQVLDDYESR